MRVVIVGIGDIGSQLAQDLSKRTGNELVLVDIDEELCEKLAAEYDALVLHGDGTDPAVLRKAQIEEADALIAATSSDATNTVIAMLSHRFKVSKTVVRLEGVGLRAACNEIGVDKIIAPKRSAATEIMAFLYGRTALDFTVAVRGGARLVELSPGDAAGKRVSELGMPPGSLITAIIRDEKAIIPCDDTKLQEDDLLLILAEDEKIMDKCKDMFGELERGATYKGGPRV